jgi:3D (Asp-Asp-Asp) domain-containing protein
LGNNRYLTRSTTKKDFCPHVPPACCVSRLAPLFLAALCAAHGVAWPEPAVAPTPAQVSPEVDKAYAQLMAAPAIQKLLEAVKADHERSVEDLKMLTEIEAPPFKEHKRAEAFLARMKALGLTDAKIDAEGNVVGLRKGTGNGPRLLVSAHLDTVFPAGTDVKVKERDGRLYAPGIADDTRGLSVLLSWLKVLNDNKVQTVGDLLFVANVGEEELGNLRGMKAIFQRPPGHRRHGRAGALAAGRGAGAGHREPPLRGELPGPGRPQLRRLRPGAQRHPRHGPRHRQDRRRAHAELSQDHLHGRHGGRWHLGQHHCAGRAHGHRHPLGRHGRAAGHREEDPGRHRRSRGRGEQALEREHPERQHASSSATGPAAARRPTR